MMQSKSQKRILAMWLSFSLVFSAAFVSSAEGSVVNLDKDVSSSDALLPNVSELDVSGSDANIPDVSSSDISGSDVSGSDVGIPDVSSSDVSGSDVLLPDVSESDVSSSDIAATEATDSMPIENSVFRVTDGRGGEFGAYGSWDELLEAFKNKGNAAEEYTIVIGEDGVIGKIMPSKAAKLTLSPAAEEGVLQFSTATVNLTTALEIISSTLHVAGGEKPVNFNTKGKTLTLRDVKNLGAVKGTSAGELYLDGDVEIQDVLKTFKNVTVNGSVKLAGNASAIANLNLESGAVYLTSGKNFTVTNVATGEKGTLVYPAEGSIPNVKIGGKVTGVLSLRKFAEVDGESVEQYFAAGSKLLTAAKAEASQFAIYGEKQLCYKKSSAIYAGAEVLQLYAGDEFLGTYVQWSDLVGKINSLKQKSTKYRVVLLDDYVVNGALTMPAKGKYAGLEIENGTEKSSVSLVATKNISMTADLDLGEAVHVQAAAVTGAAWRLRMEENAELVTTGALTVKELSVGRSTVLQSGGKFTVKTLLEADGLAELILTQKKGAAIKDTQLENDGYITVKVRDVSDKRVTLTQGTNLFTVSGSSYATQFCLLDAGDMPMGLYRKGNAIKVQGNTETPVTLYYVTEYGEISLGEYAALADIKTEIARRKDAKASYHVDVGQEVFVKGAIPLSKAGTYQELIFSGEQIRTTGNITLTGNVTFYNKICKVKSQTDSTLLVLAVNASKYKLTIPRGAAIEKLGSVTGSAGSGLSIASDTLQDITGDVKVETLWLDGTIQVSGSIAVTDIYPGEGNKLVYDLTKGFSIKGNILGEDENLVLNPRKSGKDVTAYTEGMKVIGSATKLDVSRLEMAWPAAEYEFYRDKGAVKLGTAMITVFSGTLDYESCQSAGTDGQKRFVRYDDAIVYINGSEQTDFVVRLDRDVPSSGAFTAPAKGKHLVLCGLDGESRTLKLSGSVTLDGSSLEIRRIKLDNGSASGTGVVLKNGASLWLCDTEVYTVSAPEGTSVTLEGQVSLKGAMSGAGNLTVWKDAVIRGNGAITVKGLTLHKESGEKGHAEFRLMSGKKITVDGAVESGDRGYFTVIWVNKLDVMTSVSEGTVMVTSQYGTASQFRTENIKPDTLDEWALTKSGNSIKTVTSTGGEGEWSDDFY